MLRLSFLSALLLPAAVAAQATHAIVATKLSGVAKTQLLSVDLTNGQATAFSRFSHDALAPLALAIDPLNRDVILALELGSNSRLVRLGVAGTSVVRVKLLADVSGHVTSLGFHSDSLDFAVGGASGALWKMQRNGSTPVLVARLPRVSAMSSVGYGGPYFWLAESGSTTPAIDPQIRLFDVATASTSIGPGVFKGFKPVDLTGVAEVPTALIRVIVSGTDGRLYLSVMLQTPTMLNITPALPAGATRALRMRTTVDAVVLGGAVHPYLETTTVFGSSPMKWKRLSGQLPGDPVAFDLVPPAAPVMYMFGDACAPGALTPPSLGSSGVPKLGSSFDLVVRSASPSAAVALVLGASDQAFATVPLPLALPGGCRLFVSPDLVFGRVTDASGYARVRLVIPNQAALAGGILFGQWLEPRVVPSFGFSATSAAAIHVSW